MMLRVVQRRGQIPHVDIAFVLGGEGDDADDAIRRLPEPCGRMNLRRFAGPPRRVDATDEQDGR
jgi:hypothetical protein